MRHVLPRLAAVVLALASAPLSAAGDNAFNPAISLILSGTYGRFEQDPADYTIPGFALGEETEPGVEGLSLGESELVMSANVDAQFFGRFTAALAPDGGLSVEEAFLRTLALPAGLTLQAGRFYSELGYLNSRHVHQWDFVDQPLVYRAFLANQYGDDGVQLSWLAPTDHYLLLGTELLRGDGYPAGGAARQGAGSETVFVTTGGDIGVSHSWQAGLGYLYARADPRDTSPPALSFSGDTRQLSAHLVWKWAPQGNPYQHNLVLQGEYLASREQGVYSGDASGSADTRRNGWYAQGVYQFVHGWRAGLRYDHLSPGSPGAALAGTVLDPQGHQARRMSLMLDFSHSEFSRLRLQYNHDQSSPQADRQWFLQYIMSLGAHGAHRF